jgi:hypothetical protein
LKLETLDHADLLVVLQGGDLEAHRRAAAEEVKREQAAAKHKAMEETGKERPETKPGFAGPAEQAGTA